MNPKLILVPLSGGEEDGTALGIARTVATRFDAHIDAVFVTPDPKDSVLVLGDGLSTLMVDEIMRASETVWRTRAATARKAFDSLVSAGGVTVATAPGAIDGPSIRWREEVGRIDELVICQGRLADMIVFAHPTHQHDITAQQAVEAALLFTGRPVLMAPAPPERFGRVVAVAWNGKIEASRAVAAALPILAAAERVHILTARTADTTPEDGVRLAESLAWRGITAHVETLDAAGGPVPAALCRRVNALGADLLVMGAYGHSRVREMILGGATRHVLAHPGPAILLVH